MPNIRGKAIRSELAPAIDELGGVVWQRDPIAANINRARRQVAKSHRTPWRRPTT
jgi:hypothetical protein